MKKIIMVMMMVFGLSTVFAEPFLIMDFEEIETFFVSDTENPDLQKVIAEKVSGLTDWEISDYLFAMFRYLYENKGYVVTPDEYFIEPVETLTKEYGMYTMIDYNEKWVIPVIDLGDGRQIQLWLNLSK